MVVEEASLLAGAVGRLRGELRFRPEEREAAVHELRAALRDRRLDELPLRALREEAAGGALEIAPHLDGDRSGLRAERVPRRAQRRQLARERRGRCLRLSEEDEREGGGQRDDGHAEDGGRAIERRVGRRVGASGALARAAVATGAHDGPLSGDRGPAVGPKVTAACALRRGPRE